MGTKDDVKTEHTKTWKNKTKILMSGHVLGFLKNKLTITNNVNPPIFSLEYEEEKDEEENITLIDSTIFFNCSFILFYYIMINYLVHLLS